MTEQSEFFHRQVRAMLRIAEAMNASLPRQAMLDQILAAITEELQYKAASLRMLDPENRILTMAAAHGLSDAYLSKGAVELAHSGLDRLVFTGQTVAVADAASDPGLQYPQAVLREGIRSVLAVPLRLGDRVMGTLRVYTAAVHEFSEEERAFLAGAANLAARAIQNAHIYESWRSVAQQVNSTLEVDQVLANLLRSLIDQLRFKAALVRLIGPTGRRLHVAATQGLSAEYLAKGDVRIADSPMDRHVLETGQPFIVFDVKTQPGFQYPQEALQEGIRSALSVPLRLHDIIIGVLRVYSAQPHRFTPDEIALVEAIADLGAVALENARLHEALKEKYEAAREDWSGWFRYLTLS